MMGCGPRDLRDITVPVLGIYKQKIAKHNLKFIE